MLSPQSQHAIDTLLGGNALGAESGGVGPLNDDAIVLLTVITDKLAVIQRLSGESQAKEIRNLYIQELKAEKFPSSVVIKERGDAIDPTDISWRLSKLKCQSIRGLAPYGHEFEFEFAGKSTLIYGPNGSGKSSLMAAISWIFRGIAVTDADTPSEIAPIRSCVQQGKTSKKITDWPVIAALPESAVGACVHPEFWSEIELKDVTRGHTLYLRRDCEGQLYSSTDGIDWKTQQELKDIGISALDIQLSLIASTAFGRHSLEACEDTRSILSLMLGYDDLEQIGDLVSKASGNCTRLCKGETQAIDGKKQELRDNLKSAATILDAQHDLHAQLVDVANLPDPGTDQIAEIGRKTKNAIDYAQNSLAKLLGIQSDEQSAPTDIADSLITAIGILEKGVRHCFSLLAQQRVDAVFPISESRTSEDQLADVESRLREFEEKAKGEIAKRYEWWKKETAPGSKARLLLLAAQHYDVLKEVCPVCDASVKNKAVESELEQLKVIDPALVDKAESCFSNLLNELNKIVAPAIASIGDTAPADRIKIDWNHLADDLIGGTLSEIVKKHEGEIDNIVEALPQITVAMPVLLPPNVAPAFAELANDLVSQVEKASRSMATLRWGQKHLDVIENQLHSVICDSQNHGASLLASFIKGRSAADDLQPLKNIRQELQKAYVRRKEVDELEASLKILIKIQDAMNCLKGLRRFAQSEVERVFTHIDAKTARNWNLLYSEMTMGFQPGSLGLGTGRDKTIEAMLTRNGNYDVPSQYFANAGLRRAIALAFFFALLEDHPLRLGFIIMDDPILSLDDDHREKWSRELLRPSMSKLQFVVATHQRQYLNNCRNDFKEGQTFEFIPRQWPAKVAWRPGGRLERAAEELSRAPTNAATEMRKYREELYAAFELYNSEPIKLTTDVYAGLKVPNPLVSANRDKIVRMLLSPEIARVLDPGSHALTEGDVSHAMATTCLQRMRVMDNIVVNEFERLDDLAYRAKRSLGVISPSRELGVLPVQVSVSDNQTAFVIGRAAAQSDNCVIDEATPEERLSLAIKAAALVASNCIEPVAMRGHWILLAGEGDMPQDGDLVAVEDDADQRRYLRRGWSDGSRWILHAINPVLNIPAVAVTKHSAIQKVIGVLYESAGKPSSKVGADSEWQPRADFDAKWLQNANLIRIEGDSLNPIARRGQFAVVGKQPVDRPEELPPGTLAAIDTTGGSIGQVIKCIFPGKKHWILTSRNPVEKIHPLVVPRGQIRSVWPVRGVLFERAIAQSSQI